MDYDQTNPTEDPTVLEALRRYLNRPAEGIEAANSEDFLIKKDSRTRLVLFAIVCFLMGQFLIEFLREALGVIGVLFLLGGFILTVFAFLREKHSTAIKIEPDTDQEIEDESRMRIGWLLPSFVMAIVASLMYKQGSLSLVSGLLWVASIAAITAAFFQPKVNHKPDFRSLLLGLTGRPQKLIAYLVLIAAVLVFQFGKLPQAPPEIISSQVEAYYTVDGISNGDTYLWFPRNVISEPLSYYWAAIVNQFTGDSLSFSGLKFAYSLAGLVAFFYMYKLGRRLWDEKSGYISALLLGVGFWPILQQRSVLGFGLVLPIMVPALYYLYKSLQEDDLNSLLIASVLTGLGLLTNKIFIALVFANLLITIVYLTNSNRDKAKNTLIMRIGLGLIVGIVVTLPLIFVIAANPAGWTAPIFNQFSIANNPDGSSPLITFFNNLLSAVGMTNWNNHSSWVDGIPNRAALDWVSGAFFLFGICVTLFHDLFRSRRQAISLIVLYLLMLLPSAFSIAQPLENPSLSRALGAAVPVFLIAGRGLSFTIERLWSSEKESHWVRQALFIGLLGLMIIIRNFGLINSTYVQNYKASAWNATEMAEVIRNYNIGQTNNSQAYVVGFPHWVDARSVAISMDRPYTNLSILPQDLSSTLNLQTAKIFLLHINDSESLSQLQSLYPGGVATIYQSVHPDKNFLIYIASQ
ncbi:MAG TPA: hypothetical protein DD636_02150 [Anaerolineaceae bacterium]|nr:hypothetical protein [Anaerolineaceae bacterium]